MTLFQEDFQSLTYGFRMAGDETDSSITSAVKEVDDELSKVIKVLPILTFFE